MDLKGTGINKWKEEVKDRKLWREIYQAKRGRSPEYIIDLENFKVAELK